MNQIERGMDMKVTLERGKLTIDVSQLLEGLTNDERMDLAESLSITDGVIERVAQQIVDGYTERVSHGMRDYGAAEPATALDKAIRSVALGAGDVAAKEINELVSTLKVREAFHALVDEWAWKMWRMMNDARRDGYPEPPLPPSYHDVKTDAFIVVRNDGVNL